MKDVKSLQDLIDAEFARPLHDTSTPFDRLRELTQRGIDAPTKLNADEIQQISFALSVLLSEERLAKSKG